MKAESKIAPGNETYEFVNDALSGNIDHDSDQLQQHPNNWTLSVFYRDDQYGRVLMFTCHDDEPAKVVPPPSLKDLVTTVDFDCTIRKDMAEPPYPTKGRAHLHINADKLQAIVTLINLNVNGLDNKTVTLAYPLKQFWPGNDNSYLIAWNPSEREPFLGQLGFLDPSYMTTIIPGGWPAWTGPHLPDDHFYGVFSCRIASSERGQ